AADPPALHDALPIYVTVTDTESPTILGCPSNIAHANDPGACQAAVSWTPPTASDNCAVTSFTSNHNPGATFPVGMTTVTYTAMSSAENTSERQSPVD